MKKNVKWITFFNLAFYLCCFLELFVASGDLKIYPANDAADNGRIAVNGKIVKPSYEVKVGDIVEIKFGDKISRFEILQIPKVQGKDIGEIIKII